MFLKLISNVEVQRFKADVTKSMFGFRAPFESHFWILCWSIFWGCHANIGSCFKPCRLGLLNHKEWENISDTRWLKRTRRHGWSRGVGQVPGKSDWGRIYNNITKPNHDWGIFPGRFVVLIGECLIGINFQESGFRFNYIFCVRT